MKIKTKLESIEAIRKLELNQFPELFLTKIDEQRIKLFLQDTQAEWYAIRDKMVVSSPKHKIVKSDEVIKYCQECKIEKFTIEVALCNHFKNQILVGEICVCGDAIDYILSNKSNFTLRDCYGTPDYNGSGDIFDKKLRRIKGFNKIMDYIFEHNLFNFIVEFSVFNCPIGTKNENVVIWELRTDY